MGETREHYMSRISAALHDDATKLVKERGLRFPDIWCYARRLCFLTGIVGDIVVGTGGIKSSAFVDNAGKPSLVIQRRSNSRRVEFRVRFVDALKINLRVAFITALLCREDGNVEHCEFADDDSSMARRIAAWAVEDVKCKQ